MPVMDILFHLRKSKWKNSNSIWNLYGDNNTSPNGIVYIITGGVGGQFYNWGENRV
jgi:hypothetical protein